ncbi:hypothetical protein SporoP37_01985 [Sporosarcina sp. P37]|uniref:hypothetical protein n=1 Tax=unclassified Sporosarcina TaxID=2647733 RepID=UPI000A17D94D|nr:MULTISPECIES: hypothetical protein [unclassified Sporosarcina]ARK23582.1 hypothetical protein SporoP37_01985 [Sporosarcina sp. P37]PID18795.1 hypothetical protein CSV62_06765 [Sporosarcina sp. P35]
MNNLLFIIFLLSAVAIGIFVILSILEFIKKNKPRGLRQIKFAGLSAAVMIVSLVAFVATADPATEESEEVATEDEQPEQKEPAEEPEKETKPITEDPKKEVAAPAEVEKPNVEKPVESTPKPETKPEIKEESVEKEQPTSEPEEDSTWDDLKNKDNIVGKSDKDFKKLTKTKPGKVRNDKTGKWKKVSFAENADVEDYLLSYADLYMKDDGTHFIINFNYKTTTVVNKIGGLISADVHEYVSKEEHDASKIGSGMLLKSYFIYPDGDIEEVE